MAEQRNIHTTGIILKKHPFGENDFSVTIYSPELGKIQAIAKGARKIKSSLAGHIETLNICNFQLYKSPASYTMVQCQIQESFKEIRKDFERTLIAGMLVEIFHKSTVSSEHSEELFKLLAESLRKLSTSQHHFLIVESFKLNLLQQVGVLPDLENCASCNQRWNTNDTIWLETNGSLHCHDCNPKTNTINPNAKKIELNIIKLIRYLSKPISEQTQKIVYNMEQKAQLEHITRFFLQHFIEREIVSERILMDF